MSNIASSLETIRDELKAKIAVKIAEMPESQALTRIEAAIEEINGVMALIGGLGIGAIAAVAAEPVVAAEVVAEPETVAEAETVAEVAETLAEKPEAEDVEAKSIVDVDALAADIFADEPVKTAKAA